MNILSAYTWREEKRREERNKNERENSKEQYALYLFIHSHRFSGRSDSSANYRRIFFKSIRKTDSGSLRKAQVYVLQLGLCGTPRLYRFIRCLFLPNRYLQYRRGRAVCCRKPCCSSHRHSLPDAGTASCDCLYPCGSGRRCFLGLLGRSSESKKRYQ